MNNTNLRPGFWTRLGRALINLFKVFLFILLVTAIVLGVWYGYRLLIAPTVSRVELLRSDVDTLMADTADADAIATLEADVAALEAQVEAGQTALAMDLEDQQAVLSGLQLQVAALVTNTSTYSEEIDALQNGLIALQEDVNVNSAMVDELGGALDQVDADMAALDTEFMAVREDAGELAQMQQTLTLFRVWELLSRARLQLLQGNAGLARADVATALATVNRITATASEEEGAAGAPSLSTLQQRLELTLQNLPSDPVIAGRDLQTAWETLDQLLASLLGVEEVEATTPLTGTQSVTATVPLTQTSP